MEPSLRDFMTNSRKSESVFHVDTVNGGNCAPHTQYSTDLQTNALSAEVGSDILETHGSECRPVGVSTSKSVLPTSPKAGCRGRYNNNNNNNMNVNTERPTSRGI